MYRYFFCAKQKKVCENKSRNSAKQKKATWNANILAGLFFGREV